MKKVTIKDISIELEKSVDEILKAGRELGFEVVDENSKVIPEKAMMIAETFSKKEPDSIEKEIISEDKPKIYKHKKPINIRLIRKEFKKKPIDTKNSKHFIDCEVYPDICPILWEELAPTDDENKRYCKYCKRNILRIDDKETLEKYQNTTQCLAISEKLLEKMDLATNEDLEKRLLFSKLFLLFKHNHLKYWNKIKFLDKEEKIIKMIDFIENKCDKKLTERLEKKLKNIKKGIKDENMEEKLKVRKMLKEFFENLQKETEFLKNYKIGINQTPTQQFWSERNGFRVGFYKGESYKDSTQINLTIGANWGGGVFIKDNENLIFGNKKLLKKIKKKYPDFDLNKNDNTIWALSFKNKNKKIHKKKKILKAIKKLDKIYKIALKDKK